MHTFRDTGGIDFSGTDGLSSELGGLAPPRRILKRELAEEGLKRQKVLSGTDEGISELGGGTGGACPPDVCSSEN